MRCYKAAMTPRIDASGETARLQILDAAEVRFRRYGYTKTTMAEIADDVDMSTANLYRYFENKQDLAAACAGRCMTERLDRLRPVARDRSLSAGDRLRSFILATYEHTRERCENEPGINQLVDAIASERPDIVQAHGRSEIALIAELLAHGNESGEFDVGDVVSTAEAIYASIVLFEVPIFQRLYSDEVFRRIAVNIANLMIAGVKKR